MTRNAQDIMDNLRHNVKPSIAKMLLEANFEGCGKEDKAEFETEFEMILTLAEMALEQEPILDRIRAELIDAIQNGTLKLECGNETLFNIIDKYRAGNEE